MSANLTTVNNNAGVQDWTAPDLRQTMNQITPTGLAALVNLAGLAVLDNNQVGPQDGA
jgi:hypothetical protein